jgi:hypothetical protein
MPAATGEGEAAEEAPAATEPADAEAGGFAVPWEDLTRTTAKTTITYIQACCQADPRTLYLQRTQSYHHLTFLTQSTVAKMV